jgi:hypothetical protein
MIRYRTEIKESKMLGNPRTESHGLDIGKKSCSRLLMLTQNGLGHTAGWLLTCMQP